MTRTQSTFAPQCVHDGLTFIHLYYNRAANVRKSKNPRATLGEQACPARLPVVGQNQAARKK